MKVNNNPNQPMSPYNTSASSAAPPPSGSQLHVTRELDGVKDDGIIGTILDQGTGTQSLAEANKFFALPKYSITGLLSENNQLTPQATKVSAIKGSADDNGILCADDMYGAGDPIMGGKGNNYVPVTITPQPGYYTMFKDGLPGGPQITVNSHVETINPDGNHAFTEYGFVVTDGTGQKTQATLSGGQLTIVDPCNQTRKFLPGDAPYLVGNPNDPTAKFYYADVPGAGKDGATEKRLLVDYYEKPSADTINKLVAQGMDPQKAAALRTKTTMSYGFRVPDGVNTYAQPEGVGSASPMKTTDKGVKTYYDAHFSEGACSLQDIVKHCPPAPPPSPVAVKEHARIWGDPHIDDPDGGRFNVHDEGIYSILQDKNIQINGEIMKGKTNPNVSFVTKAGIQVGNFGIQANADGTVTMSRNKGTGAFATQPFNIGNGYSTTLEDGTKISRVNDVLTIETGEYKTQVALKRRAQATTYMNIDVYTKAQGVNADKRMPNGMLGELFDPDRIAETKLKNDIKTYRRADLFSSQLPNVPTPAPSPAPKPAPAPSQGTTNSIVNQIQQLLQQMISWLTALLGGGQQR